MHDEPSGEQKSPVEKMFGDFAPKLVQATDEVLFADIWEREELGARDRSLITITALVAGGHVEQLPHHLERGRDNGLTQTEVIEAITHLAFYCGWPRAMFAMTVAQEVFGD